MTNDEFNLDNPVTFFKYFGNLHDVRILDVKINIGFYNDNDFMDISIDDLYKAVKSSNETVKKNPIKIRFYNINDVFVSVNLDEGVRIGEVKIRQENNTPFFSFMVFLNIGYNLLCSENCSIFCNFSKMEII